MRIAAAAFGALLRHELDTIRHRKVIYLAGDVAQALKDKYTVPVSMDTMAALMGIEIVASPEMPPGAFRLVRHDGCEVIERTSTVSHGRCTIVAEGTVELRGEKEQQGRE